MIQIIIQKMLFNYKYLCLVQNIFASSNLSKESLCLVQNIYAKKEYPIILFDNQYLIASSNVSKKKVLTFVQNIFALVRNIHIN